MKRGGMYYILHVKSIKFKNQFPSLEGEGQGGVIYNDPLPLTPSLREGE